MLATARTSSSRLVYLDMIRIAAIFSVIVIHITACEWGSLPVASLRWQMLNLYNAVSRWCIAGFVLMSGRAFLDLSRPLPFRVLLKKNILRMFWSLLFWATAYHLYETYLTVGRVTVLDLYGGVVRVFTLNARRHLWFLYLMIGLYLLTPLLRYLIARFSIRTLAAASIVLLAVSGITPLALSTSALYPLMQYVMQVPGFVGLFVLGYCLDHLRLSKGAVRLLYAAGLLGAVFTVAATSLVSLKTGSATQIFYSNTAPNVIITAIGLLVFGRRKLYALSFGPVWDKRLSRFATLTYAIYLVHDFFVIALDRGLGGVSIHLLQPAFSVVVFSCWVLLLCTPVAYLLRKIPVINRFLA